MASVNELDIDFGMLDPKSGAFLRIGTGSQPGPRVGDLARSSGGTLYGIGSDWTLVTIDPIAGTSTMVGDTGGGNRIVAIKFRKDGVLFGASFTDLYTIDPVTAQATLVGPFGVSLGSGGIFVNLAIDASGNVFLEISYVSSAVSPGTGTLYAVNSSLGVATEIGPIGFVVAATEFAQGALYGFTGCSSPPCPGSQVITIDTTTGAGTALATETPPGIEVFAGAAIVGP
jgi:hypothetical protein